MNHRWFLISVAVVAVVASVAWEFRNRSEMQANRAIATSNADLQAGFVAAFQFQEKAVEAGKLLNEKSFREERAKLTTMAREASALAGESEVAFRRAAAAVQHAMDLTKNERFRAEWMLKRDSLLQRAEGAAAGGDGYAVVADESIADLATLLVRMEPFAVCAERAKAEADRLNAEAVKAAVQNRASP